MKKISAVLWTAAAAMMLTACGGSADSAQTDAPASDTSQQTDAQDTQAAALDYDKLIIGVDDTFAPMGFIDENGDLAGFDIDMANAVGEKLGIPVEFQTIEWTMKEQELNQGNIDLIWNGYSITDERKEEVLFTNPYLDNEQVVVTMADSGIETLDDLAGKVVAAQENSSAVDAIDAHPDLAATFADRPEFATNDMAIMDMEAGRSDAVIADSVL